VVKKCQSGKWSCFGCVGSPCESVDSNQWLPLQCKLCMNINDVNFGRSNLFYVHVKMAFVLTLTVQFNIWTFPAFWGILCIHAV
jgi:hypothetical protein